MAKFEVYVSKDVVEDSWTDGEIGRTVCSMDHEKYGLGTNFLEALNDACNTLFGKEIPLGDFSNCADQDFIMYARTENKDGEVPSESELQDWRSGKINLFSAMYTFTVEKKSLMTSKEFIEAGIPND